jgi:hypothetical protein
MAWWRFWNLSEVPICISIGSAGVTQYCTNNLAVGGYWECDVTGWPLRDLDVVKAGQGRLGEFNFKVGDSSVDDLDAPNQLDLWGRVVASVPTQGASSFAPWITASAETLAHLRDWAHARQKQVVTMADCHYDPNVDGFGAWAGPLWVSNIWGPDGYNIYIRGATVTSGVACVPGEDPKLIGFRNTQLYADATNNASRKQSNWQSQV